MLLYSIIVTCLIVQCFTIQSNEVEYLSSSEYVSYGDRRCNEPALVGEGTTSPSGEIGLYDTYTLTCDDDYHLELGAVVIVGIENVFTCMPSTDDNTTYLDPDTMPECANTYNGDLSIINKMSYFFEEVDADAGGDLYSVVTDDLGCWVGTTDRETDSTIFDAVACSGQTNPVNYIDMGCELASNKTLVGYYTLRVFERWGPFGEDVRDDTETVIVMECLDPTSTSICKDVDQQDTSSSRLHVHLYKYNSDASGTRDTSLTMNIKAGDSSFKYRFRCDDGYSFQESVGSVDAYGYCSTSGGDDPANNVFSVFKEGTTSPALDCYSLCEANPAVGYFTDSEISYENIYIPTMKKDATFDLTQKGVSCAEDYALATDADDEFTITCVGADATEGPNEGKFSCSSCPFCYEMCSEKFNISADNGVDSIDIVTSVMRETQTVTLDAVTCDAGYALSEEETGPYQFVCGEGGTYFCVGECPVCQGTCSWPEDVNGTKFRYVDTSRVREGDEAAIPGNSHVEAYCEDIALALVGPRYLSCIGSNSTNHTLVYDSQGYGVNVTTICEENTTVCSAPNVFGAVLDKTGNIRVGGNYTVTCDEDKMFDLDTTDNYGSDNTAVLHCPEPVVPVNGSANVTDDNLPELYCYSGCKEITFISGTFVPKHKTSGQAPYASGEVVTFTCQTGHHLVNNNEKEQACTDGAIKIPECAEDEVPEPTEEPTEAANSASLSLALLSLTQLVFWGYTS